MVVSCRLMKGGAVLEEAEIPLEANGQEAQFIEEIFTTTDASDFVGSVRCTGRILSKLHSPEWPWSWMPATASLPHCRWCL